MTCELSEIHPSNDSRFIMKFAVPVMTASSGRSTATTHTEDLLTLMTSAASRVPKPLRRRLEAAEPAGRGSADAGPVGAAGMAEAMAEAGAVAAVSGAAAVDAYVFMGITSRSGRADG